MAGRKSRYGRYSDAILSCIVFCSFFSFSQDPAFRNFSVDNGLPSVEVYQMLADSKGYLWFATDMGVCRYNGDKFKCFTTREGLSDNTVFKMCEDHRGRIWLYTFSGKISWISSGKVHNFKWNKTVSEEVPSQFVNSIFVDREDTVWLGCRKGIFWIASSGKHGFRTNRRKIGFQARIFNSGHIVWSRRPDWPKKGYVEIQDERRIIKLPPCGNKDTYGHDFMVSWKDGVYAFCGSHELIIADRKRVLARRTFSKEILSLCKEGNAIWVGFRSGGALRIPSRFHLFSSESDYLPEKSVTCVMKDRENGYWFTTLESGVYYCPSMIFRSYTTGNSSLRDSRITGLAGRRNGEVFFTLFNNQIGYIRKGKIHLLKMPGQPQLQLLKGIYVDKQERLWITWHGNALLVEGKIPGSGRPDYRTSGSTGGAISFFEDPKGSMWLAQKGRISKIQNGIGQTFLPGPDLPNSGRFRIEAIAERFGTLYLASLDGVWTFRNGRFKHPGRLHSLLRNRVVDIRKDGKNRLWFATRGAGLIVLDGRRLIQLTEEDGLSSNFVTTLFIDREDGFVWVGTNKGISLIRKSDLKKKIYQIARYSVNNGLISNQINAIFRRNDTVWLATSLGLTVFNIHQLMGNKVSPAVYLDKVIVNGSEVKYGKKTLSLDYRQNSIRFEYEGVSFMSRDRLPYRYRLEGIDSGWTFTHSNSVKYSGLPSGSYRFRVETANTDDVWSSKPASIRFTISRPFFKTIWFIMLLVVLLTLVVWVGFLLYFRRIREKERMIHLISESEQKALRSQMNPHFIFNSLNSIQRFVMKNDKLSSSIYLSKFSNLMRAILENSQSSYIYLEAEIQLLQLYLELETLRFDHLSCTITVGEEVDRVMTTVPTMLIQPYVENAVKHGLSTRDKDGIIEIDINDRDGLMVYSIKDNGIGRDQAAFNREKDHLSMGQKITMERIAILNATRREKISLEITDLFSKNHEACGTIVTIYIPTESIEE